MLRRLRFELRYLMGDTPWDTGESPPELLAFLHSHDPGRAIDLGCGTGTNAITIAEHGWRAVGIDQSFVAIGKAKLKAGRHDLDVQLVRGDVTHADRHPRIDGTFDLALDIGCLHTLRPEQLTGYADSLRRLISTGGTYLLYSFLRPPGVAGSRWRTEATIRALFESGFELVQLEHGTYHEKQSGWFTYRRVGS